MMWNPEFRIPFIDRYCREGRVEELFAFFDEDGELLPGAPGELALEVAAIRGEIDFERSPEYQEHVRCWESMQA